MVYTVSPGGLFDVVWMVVDEVIVVDAVDVYDVKMLVDWIAVADDVDVDIVELIVGVNAARMLKIRINWCDDRTKIVQMCSAYFLVHLFIPICVVVGFVVVAVVVKSAC